MDSTRGGCCTCGGGQEWKIELVCQGLDSKKLADTIWCGVGSGHSQRRVVVAVLLLENVGFGSLS